MRIVAALLAAGMGLGSLAVAAQADVLNPRDPDYCGRAPDILWCTEHRSTYPNEGESQFLTAVRGRYPGNEAKRLAAGRAICLEFPSQPVDTIVDQIAGYLHLAPPAAGEVVELARVHICPPKEED